MNIKKFKRASAAALVAAVVALGTSCGVTNLPPENTTASTPIESTTNINVEDVKPVYSTLFSKEDVSATIEFNDTLKNMINYTFSQNFDYYVENLTVTSLSFEPVTLNEEVATDYVASNQVKVSVVYNADVVGKESEEKSNVSNGISYIINNSTLATMNQDNADYVDVLNEVNESTTQKLENNEINAQDQVSGRQSNLTNEFLSKVASNYIDEIYDLPEVKQYLDDGYSLYTTTTRPYRSVSSSYLEYSVQLHPSSEIKYERLTVDTPYGWVDNSSDEMTFVNTTCGMIYNILAVNEETGDMRFLNVQQILNLDVSLEEFAWLNQYFYDHSVIDIDRFFEDSKNEEGFIPDVTSTQICGEEGFTEQLYNFCGTLTARAPKGGRIDYITDVAYEDINDYKSKVTAMALADENNTNVFVKEPTAESELEQ